VWGLCFALVVWGVLVWVVRGAWCLARHLFVFWGLGGIGGGGFWVVGLGWGSGKRGVDGVDGVVGVWDC
jgi:hypothetical protein